MAAIDSQGKSGVQTGVQTETNIQFSKLISVARREACKRAGRALMGVALVGAMGYAQAQTYPDRPITFIVPFPAGTAADLSARLFAAEMGRILNQSIVVQNRTGAGGGIAAAQVARAAPDGYTVLVGSLGTHVFNKGLYKNLPYDPVKDFVPVSRFFSVANVLVVRSSLGISNFGQFVELAKKQKDKPLSYGSAGAGTSAHLSGAQLAQLTGVELLHVPFQATPASINELLAGRIDIVFGNINIVLPHVKSGSLKALAITTAARSPLMPDVPTVTEVGIPQAEVSTWGGLFLPAGTPHAIAVTLNNAVRKASVESEAIKKSADESGSMVETDPSPEAFARQLKADSDKWLPVISATRASAD